MLVAVGMLLPFLILLFVKYSHFPFAWFLPVLLTIRLESISSLSIRARARAHTHSSYLVRMF